MTGEESLTEKTPGLGVAGLGDGDFFEDSLRLGPAALVEELRNLVADRLLDCEDSRRGEGEKEQGAEHGC